MMHGKYKQVRISEELIANLLTQSSEPKDMTALCTRGLPETACLVSAHVTHDAGCAALVLTFYDESFEETAEGAALPVVPMLYHRVEQAC